jgi:hypothetical protein
LEINISTRAPHITMRINGINERIDKNKLSLIILMIENKDKKIASTSMSVPHEKYSSIVSVSLVNQERIVPTF